MARMRSAYWPGSILLAGKLKRPSLSLTTVMVMVEPAFLALTSTPSIAPSSAELTCPLSATVCAGAAAIGRTANANRLRPASSGKRRMMVSPG